MAISSPPTRPTRRLIQPAHLSADTVPLARSRTAPRFDASCIVSNFAALSLAEVICRATSFAVTLSLTRRLDQSGYGRIEFAFNVVFWLVLLVRDGVEVIAARELARHPRLVRPLVNHVIALKGLIASALLAGLVLVGSLTMTDPTDRAILCMYGLMLVTTALGIDFVYRGLERMTLVAVSLILRTLIYAVGIWLWVTDASRIVAVPACLALGEAVGIALVWSDYVRRFGMPRPVWSRRFMQVSLRRGRSVCLIQVSQTVIASIDLIFVGMMYPWDEVGRYCAPHRMITAVLTFSLIFQQVVFPSLARSWRQTAASGQAAVSGMVKLLVVGLLPIAVGGTVLAAPLIKYLLPRDFESAAPLLILGIWRVPLLTLAYLYRTALIAVNREAVGVRMLAVGALASGPMVWVLCRLLGPPGASSAVLLIGAGLLAAGYGCLAREGRQPPWHHHLMKPALACLVMTFACLALERISVPLAVVGGALVYFATLALIGGIPRFELASLLQPSRQVGCRATEAR